VRRSTWRASLTSALAAVLAAALVSGSRDPVSDVLAGAPGAAAPAAAAVAPPVTGPHIPWPDARTAEPPASTSRRTTPAALVDATDIPLPALTAYQRAATVIDAADPSCHLDWSLLAAIGRVESDHGRFGGSSLDAQGVDHPGVLGPRLDGRHGTSVVRDTDAGRLDHDRRYDRAVGPMQFLPATWAVVAVDGDSDGRRNVQDIDDAALGSAVYLCSGTDDLATGPGQRSAVYRYNHSSSYVSDVLAIARAYRAGSPYVGVTTSTVPTGTVFRSTLASGPWTTQPTRPTATAPASPTKPGHQPGDGATQTGGPTPTPSSTPSADPTDLPTASPVPVSHGPVPTATPSPTDPTSEPTGDPTTGPTDQPSPTDPTGEPTGDPTTGPTDQPSPTDPTGDPTSEPTSGPTDPPVVPEVRPTALAHLSARDVRLIDAAWPVCADRLPATWRARAALRCLAARTGMPRHDADLVAFVHWLARHEANATS